MSWLLLAASTSAAPVPGGCTAAVPLSEWVAELDNVEKAFASNDDTHFDAGMHRAALLLPCLSESVPPAQVGRYHRLVGLRLYVRGHEAEARLAFASARAVDPFAVMPIALLPQGHEARAMEVSPVGSERVERVSAPRRGEIYFDGQMSRLRPEDRPTLVQLAAGTNVWCTAYLSPGQPLPPYSRRLLDPSSRLAIGGTSVALAALAATFSTFAWDASSQLEAQDLPVTERHRLEGRAQGFFAGATTAGTLAVAGLTVAVVPW